MHQISYREPKNGEILEGNDRYEGYSKDLMTAISKHLKFKFELELVPGN